MNMGLAAYSGGLALYLGGGIQYVSYAGAFGAVIAVPSALNTHVAASDRWFEATPSGRVFLVTRAPTSMTLTCPNPNNVAGTVSAIEPSGVVWTTGLLTQCSYVHAVHPMPSGGFALRYGFVPQAGGAESERLAVFGGNGGVQWDREIGGQSDPYDAYVSSVTMNGDVAVRLNSARWYSVNGSTYRFPMINFRLFSGVTGEPFAGAQFTLRGDTTTTAGPSYMWGGSGELALAKNTVYVVATQCTTQGICNNPTKLYAFKVPGVEMDYPRGAIFRSGEAKRPYVALGDSFSSGEGVPPFEAGTDLPGLNVCHRSTRAYPRLLVETPALGLQMQAFRACSGATVVTMSNGQYNEPLQFSALTSATKVVTLTIGGNDIGFADVVLLCATQAVCEFAIDNARDHLAPTDIGAKLGLAYREVKKRAPNARVYVLGYPSLVPSAQADVGRCTWDGLWLDLQADRRERLRSHGDDLNAYIKLETEKVGFTFVPNKTFEGHELCTADPYVLPVRSGATAAYSLHPNLKGAEATYRLLAGIITS